MSERSTDMATLSEHRGKQHIVKPNRRLESNRKEQGISTPPSGLVTSHDQPARLPRAGGAQPSPRPM